MGSEFYGLTRKWFLQLDVELADLNGISHKINKKQTFRERLGERLSRETESSSS